MSHLRRNVELKACFSDLAAGHAIAQRLGAVQQPPQHQIDTYFPCRQGRLKLREIEGQTAQLIWYARENRADAKSSDYMLVEIADPAALKQALDRAYGASLVVDKQRAIYIWDGNVRIHLDRVARLGDFLEFEAVLDASHDEQQGRRQLEYLSRQFSLQPADLREGSYSDLLANRPD